MFNKKSTRGVHFTILPASHHPAEFYEIWHTRSTHGHNHMCQIFSRSVQGLRSSDTPNIAFSHWLAASHLQQCAHCRATLWSPVLITGMRVCSGVNININPKISHCYEHLCTSYCAISLASPVIQNWGLCYQIGAGITPGKPRPMPQPLTPAPLYPELCSGSTRLVIVIYHNAQNMWVFVCATPVHRI